MKRKIFLTLAIVVVLTCLFAIAVSAAEPSYKDGEWIYAADGTTKLAIRDTEGNPLLWYMNGEELKYVRADQTDETLDVYVKYSISAGGSGFNADHTPVACLKDIDIYDNGTQIEGATINSQIVLFNMEKLEIDALNGWLWGNKNGCCLLMRGIVFPTTLKYMGQEGFTNHKIVQMWNLENTQFEWYNTSNSAPFSNRFLTQEATNGVLKFPDTLTMNPSVQYTLIKTVIFSPNSTVGNDNQTLRDMPNLEKVYIHTGFYETGFNGEGLRGTSHFLMFFTGTEEQAAILKENTANSWGHNNHFKDDRTQIISYQTYLSDPTTYDNAKNMIYIVCGINYCDAFYDGIHNIASDDPDNKCCGTCQREECGKFEIKDDAEHTEELKLAFGENKSEVVDYYADMYVVHVCKYCETEMADAEEYGAMFANKGMSASLYDTVAIAFEIAINYDALKVYENITETTLAYGLVVSADPTATPITGVADGNAVVGANTIKVSMTGAGYTNISTKIVNVPTTKTLNCAGYVIEGEKVIYLNYETASEEAEILSYEIILEKTGEDEE